MSNKSKFIAVDVLDDTVNSIHSHNADTYTNAIVIYECTVCTLHIDRILHKILTTHNSSSSDEHGNAIMLMPLLVFQ